MRIHFVTDWAKCEGLIGFDTDQAIHYGCKILWAILLTQTFFGGYR